MTGPTTGRACPGGPFACTCPSPLLRTALVDAIAAGLRVRQPVETIADALIAGPLAPLLASATTGRGDDGAVQRVLALADHWDTDEDARYASARIARSTAARVLREAVAGGQDGPSC